jgi:23S rRNA pseudouridine1911/1915/1917 synthase
VLAVTHYEVIEEFPTPDGMISKIRLELETGRTHQIRVQAAQERLPLIGDRSYHPLYRTAVKEEVHLPVLFDRQALHAASLELEHPDNPGKRITWNAPLPEDMQELEQQLKRIRRTRYSPARDRK